MKVTCEYFIRQGRRVLERGTLDSASALYADLKTSQWAWVLTIINDLVQASPIAVQHPDGAEWYFVARFNFYGVKKAALLRSVCLVVWPKIGDYQVPPIELKPGFSLEELRRRIAASLPAHVG